MRPATRYFVNGSLAFLFLVSLLPMPAGGAGLISEGQQQVAKTAGVVSKMLEEVDLYLHSDPITLGPSGWTGYHSTTLAGGVASRPISSPACPPRLRRRLWRRQLRAASRLQEGRRRCRDIRPDRPVRSGIPGHPQRPEQQAGPARMGRS
ncbi:MAG: hypothetical protein ABIW84_02905, partial [Ilumatobacteraceae bacterium]